jgi:hypothetical protein
LAVTISIPLAMLSSRPSDSPRLTALGRQGGDPGSAGVQHRGGDPAPGRDQHHSHPGEHAVLRLDQARWHLSGDVVVTDNVTLLPLPQKCPELNFMENVWQFMRDNWLSNRVFRDHDDIVAHC